MCQPRAAATAALRRRGRRRSRRGRSATRTSHGPGCETLAQLAPIGDGRGRDAVGARRGLRCRCRGACRTAARTVGGELGRLRQEREDATAVVVDDDDPQVDAAIARERRARSSRARRRCRRRGRRSAARQRPAERRRHDPVDAVGAAVRHGRGRAVRRTTRGRAPASTRRRPTRRRRGATSARRPRHAGLGQRLVGDRTPAIAVRARFVGVPPARRPRRVRRTPESVRDRRGSANRATL